MRLFSPGLFLVPLSKNSVGTWIHFLFPYSIPLARVSAFKLVRKCLLVPNVALQHVLKSGIMILVDLDFFLSFICSLITLYRFMRLCGHSLHHAPFHHSNVSFPHPYYLFSIHDFLFYDTFSLSKAICVALDWIYPLEPGGVSWAHN